jgi:hypothetical protein
MVLRLVQNTGQPAFQQQHTTLALTSYCGRRTTDAPCKVIEGYGGGALEIYDSADYLDLQAGFFERHL